MTDLDALERLIAAHQVYANERSEEALGDWMRTNIAAVAAELREARRDAEEKRRETHICIAALVLAAGGTIAVGRADLIRAAKATITRRVDPGFHGDIFDVSIDAARLAGKTASGDLGSALPVGPTSMRRP